MGFLSFAEVSCGVCREKASGQHFIIMDKKPPYIPKWVSASLVFRVKPKSGWLFSQLQHFLVPRLWLVCSSHFLMDTVFQENCGLRSFVLSNHPSLWPSPVSIKNPCRGGILWDGPPFLQEPAGICPFCQGAEWGRGVTEEPHQRGRRQRKECGLWSQTRIWTLALMFTWWMPSKLLKLPQPCPHQRNVIKFGNINRLISPYPIFHGIFTPSLTSTNR